MRVHDGPEIIVNELEAPFTEHFLMLLAPFQNNLWRELSPTKRTFSNFFRENVMFGIFKIKNQSKIFWTNTYGHLWFPLPFQRERERERK